MFTRLGPDRQRGHSGAGVPPSSVLGDCIQVSAACATRSSALQRPLSRTARTAPKARSCIPPDPTEELQTLRAGSRASRPGPQGGRGGGRGRGERCTDRDEDQGSRSAGSAQEASAWSVPSDPLVASAPRWWPGDTPHYSPATAARLLPFLRLTSPPASGGWVCPVSRGLVRGLPQSWVPAAWPVLLVTVEQDADPGS